MLRTPAGQELRGHGQSRRNPVDRPIARIGEEVAGARAMSNLAHELLEYAAGEIEANMRRNDPLPGELPLVFTASARVRSPAGLRVLWRVRWAACDSARTASIVSASAADLSSR